MISPSLSPSLSPAFALIWFALISLSLVQLFYARYCKTMVEGGFRGIEITDHAFKITKITKSRENNAIFTITQNYCESRNHGKIHKISRFTKIDLGIFTAAIRLFSFQIPTFTDFPDQIWSNSLTEFQKTNGKIQIKRETQLIMCAPFLNLYPFSRERRRRERKFLCTLKYAKTWKIMLWVASES